MSRKVKSELNILQVFCESKIARLALKEPSDSSCITGSKDILDSLTPTGDSRPERLKGLEGRSQEQLDF